MRLNLVRVCELMQQREIWSLRGLNRLCGYKSDVIYYVVERAKLGAEIRLSTVQTIAKTLGVKVCEIVINDRDVERRGA